MMTVAEMCRSCQRDVLWLRHERTGRWAPIDADVYEDGNVAVDMREGTYRIVSTGEPTLPGLEPVAALHKNHFATCPYADRFKARPA